MSENTLKQGTYEILKCDRDTEGRGKMEKFVGKKPRIKIVHGCTKFPD